MTTPTFTDNDLDQLACWNRHKEKLMDNRYDDTFKKQKGVKHFDVRPKKIGI